jgi:hypothetical protein
MAQERTPARRDGLGDPPSEMHIEVVREPRRAARFTGLTIAAVAAAIAALAAAIAVVAATRAHHSIAGPPAAHESGAGTVSAAYG